jgi:hypothetical protein
MSKDTDINRNKDNSSYPADRSRSDINPHTRTKEEAGDPNSDSDRKGRNIDIDQENKKSEISGRSRAQDLGGQDKD